MKLLQISTGLYLVCVIAAASRGAAQQAAIATKSTGDRGLPVMLSGPVSPSVLSQRLGFTAAQVGKYAPDYKRYMKETKPERDRAATGVSGGPMNGDSLDQPQPAAGEQGSGRELVAALAQRDRDFEQEHLMPLLTGEQMRAFRNFRVERRREAVMEARRAAGREPDQPAR